MKIGSFFLYLALLLIFRESHTCWGMNNEENERGNIPMPLILDKYEGLVTIHDDKTNVLRRKTQLMSQEELSQAKIVAERLLHFRENVLKGGAGPCGSSNWSSLSYFYLFS